VGGFQIKIGSAIYGSKFHLKFDLHLVTGIKKLVIRHLKFLIVENIFPNLESKTLAKMQMHFNTARNFSRIDHLTDVQQRLSPTFCGTNPNLSLMIIIGGKFLVQTC